MYKASLPPPEDDSCSGMSSHPFPGRFQKEALLEKLSPHLYFSLDDRYKLLLLKRKHQMIFLLRKTLHDQKRKQEEESSSFPDRYKDHPPLSTNFVTSRNGFGKTRATCKKLNHPCCQFFSKSVKVCVCPSPALALTEF